MNVMQSYNEQQKNSNFVYKKFELARLISLVIIYSVILFVLNSHYHDVSIVLYIFPAFILCLCDFLFFKLYYIAIDKVKLEFSSYYCLLISYIFLFLFLLILPNNLKVISLKDFILLSAFITSFSFLLKKNRGNKLYTSIYPATIYFLFSFYLNLSDKSLDVELIKSLSIYLTGLIVFFLEKDFNSFLSKNAESLFDHEKKLIELEKSLPGVIFQVFYVQNEYEIKPSFMSSNVIEIFNFKTKDVSEITYELVNSIKPEELNVIFSKLNNIKDSTSNFEHDLKVSIKGPSEKWYRISAITKFIEKDKLQLNGVLNDISETKELEIKLENQKIEAEKAKAIAVSANNAKSSFLANMSHELRTPLNAIIGMVELLLFSDIKKEQKEYLKTILNSSESLLSIINSILDYSSLKEGKLKILNKSFNFYSEVEEVISLMAPEAEEKNINLTLRINPNIPNFLLGDRVRLKQILYNLVGNSVKFTKEGFVSIDIDLVEEDQKSVKLLFSIKDSGIGIPEESLSFVFEKYAQLEMHENKKIGTGLGLAITKEIVGLMGGSIEVYSKENKGTSFIFDIPMLKEKDKTEFNEKNYLKKVVINIFDLNIDRIKIIEELLKFWGAEINFLKSVSDISVQAGIVNIISTSDLQGNSVLEKISLFNRDNSIFLCNSSESLPYEKIIESKYNIIHSPIRRKDLFNKILKVKKIKPLDKEDTKTLNEIFNVLLVEDDEINSIVIGKLIGKLGCEVDYASNGKEAIEKVSSNNYDLIFMDYNMPVMDGFVASKRIRALEAPKSNIPIIALTGNIRDENNEAFEKDCINEYINKPVKKDDLLNIINQFRK